MKFFNTHRDHKILITGIIFGLMLGYIIGYGTGVSWALNWSVEKGFDFLEVKGIDIGINEIKMQDALKMYYSKIGDKLG